VDWLTRDSHPLPPPPSWPKVIATTLRLWMQRHVIPPRTNTPADRRHYRAISAVAAIVVAASVAAFAVGRGSDAPASPAHASSAADTAPPGLTPTQGPQALAASAASREQAAAWVAAQVSHGVIVGCDPEMCATLQQHGFPAADLATLGAAAGDPLGTGIVVATTAIRSQLGPALATVYAPDVIAAFGAGSSLIQVRVVTPGGAAAFVPAEHADLEARQVAGRELAGNSDISTSPAAKAELESGQVDSRLLITLAALAAKFHIQVVSFGDGRTGIGSGAPLRQLIIMSQSTTYLHQVLAFLDAQHPPLLAVVAQRRQGGMTTVQILFTAPSPTGLLPASGSQ
jgi:hypothetical protein